MLEVIRQIDNPMDQFVDEDFSMKGDMNRRASHHHNDFARRASHHVMANGDLSKNGGGHNSGAKLNGNINNSNSNFNEKSLPPAAHGAHGEDGHGHG